MRLTLGLSFCFLTIILFGNDGAYTTSGGNIYPVTESDIKMLSENLSFVVKEKTTYVHVEFEFFNPSSKTKSLQVGFQAPTSTGDVTDKQCNTPQIVGFTAQVNDDLMPYHLFAAECETCELKDTSEIYFSQFNNGIYVYLFDVEFQPGITVVRHSYSFPASTSVMVEEIYNYILTTGSKWADGTIGDFELTIDMGENSYFYVSDIFGESAKWSVVGTGKVTDLRVIEFGDSNNRRMVRTVNGHLRIEAQAFNPKSNLEFGVLSRSSFSTWGTDKGSSSLAVRRALMFRTLDPMALDEEKLTPSELRIIRNTIYAQKGYNFKDEGLREYFSKFHWYVPDPNLGQEEIELNSAEKEFIEQIRVKEKNY